MSSHEDVIVAAKIAGRMIAGTKNIQDYEFTNLADYVLSWIEENKDEV